MKFRVDSKKTKVRYTPGSSSGRQQKNAISERKTNKLGPREVANLNRTSSVHNSLTADKPFGGVHGNCADRVFAEMLGNLEYQADFVTLNLESTHDGRKFSVKLDVDDGSNNLSNFAIH